MSPLGFGSKKKAAAAAPAATPAPAKAPAPAPTRGVVVEKPKANIYTVMLSLAFVALLIGCLMLYFEMNAYEWKLGPK
jgi:hypothetical protein